MLGAERLVDGTLRVVHVAVLLTPEPPWEPPAIYAIGISPRKTGTAVEVVCLTSNSELLQVITKSPIELFKMNEGGKQAFRLDEIYSSIERKTTNRQNRSDVSRWNSVRGKRLGTLQDINIAHKIKISVTYSHLLDRFNTYQAPRSTSMKI